MKERMLLTYDLIKRCIFSCEINDQLDICNEMIDNLMVAKFSSKYFDEELQKMCGELRDNISAMRNVVSVK